MADKKHVPGTPPTDEPAPFEYAETPAPTEPPAEVEVITRAESAPKPAKAKPAEPKAADKPS